MRDIVAAMANITNEIQKLNKSDKAKFDQIMMSGSGQRGGFLGTLTDKGLHNTPPDTDGYKTHRSKIPIPDSKQSVVK